MLFNPSLLYPTILLSLVFLSIVKILDKKANKETLTVILSMVSGSVFMMILTISVARFILLNDMWIVLVYGIGTGISKYLYIYLCKKYNIK